jgi:type II secretory pathway pseudopilin PulG
MTLIELVVVVVIIALAASGLSFSLGALNKTNLKSGASRLAAAARFAYNRSIIRGTTVRIAFDVPGGSFSIEEANAHVTLARAKDERRKDSADKTGKDIVAVDPWASAKARISEVMKPTYGASPFKALANDDGKTLARYTKVSLGRRVQVVKLIVPHEPEPLEQGKGAIHFFPSGMTEHAVIQLSDGADSVFSVEINPLTGRCHIYARAYEPKKLLGDPDHPHESEVQM